MLRLSLPLVQSFAGLGSGASYDIAPESPGPLIAAVFLVSPHNRGHTLGSKNPQASGGD